MLVPIVSNKFLMTPLTTELPYWALPAEIEQHLAVEAERADSQEERGWGPSLSRCWTKMRGKDRWSLSANQQRAVIRTVPRAWGQVLVLENKTSSMLLPNRVFVPGNITQPETPLQLNTYALKLWQLLNLSFCNLRAIHSLPPFQAA